LRASDPSGSSTNLLHPVLKKIVIILTLIALVALGIVLFLRRPAEQVDSGKTSVVTSFYPLYFFATEIGGDAVTVTNLTPAGAEPHEYELTPQDTARVESSDLLVLNGGGLEPWAESIQKNIDASRTLTVVAGQGLATQSFIENGETITDPHLWLSPKLAQQMAEEIAVGLSQVDPSNASYYEGRLSDLKAKLVALDTDFSAGLATCKTRDIITSHSAFGYLAAAYDLEQVSITGVSTEGEPSAQDLADLAEFAQQNQIKYIFFESLVSPELAETLATEVGAQTLVLDPIEGLSDDAIEQGQDYFTQMRQNLTNLQIALECRT